MNSVVRQISAVPPDVSADQFRSAMRHLTGGVSVITAGRGGDITGMTVTSVSSLSIEPASLIVSINRDASSWPVAPAGLGQWNDWPGLSLPEGSAEPGVGFVGQMWLSTKVHLTAAQAALWNFRPQRRFRLRQKSHPPLDPPPPG